MTGVNPAQSNGPKRLIDFPDEWATGKPINHDAFTSPDKKLTIATVLLDDGSGLWVLIFEGGHRFARTAECTGWAIEERFHGDPTSEEADAVSESWRYVLRSMIRAGREVDEMLGVRRRT
jgi:hypothetical protein